MNDQHDLQVLVESRFPIIVVKTREELRVLDILERLAHLNNWPLFIWTVTAGIRKKGLEFEYGRDTNEPEAALRHIERSPQNGIFVLLDFHLYLQEPVHVRLVKNIALAYSKTPRTLIFISHNLQLPPNWSAWGRILSCPCLTSLPCVKSCRRKPSSGRCKMKGRKSKPSTRPSTRSCGISRACVLRMPSILPARLSPTTGPSP